jgi:DNA-binding transcriptional LysR family regulator
MIISTEQLNAFYVVAREKSFTRAAKKLFRTQPAISLAIRTLEEEVGQLLFVRQGRTSLLTQAGEILLQHVDEAFEAIEKGRMRIESLKNLKGGRLTITTSDTTACYLLPEVLKIFRNRYPEVEVCIQSKPSPLAAEQVLSHEADLAIVTLPVEHPRLTTEKLIIREDVVICSPNNSLASRKKFTFVELAQYPLLLLDRGSNTRAYIDERIREAGIKPKIAMELGSIEVIKKLVQLDFGVSIVPRIAVQEELERGLILAKKIFKADECRSLGFIYPARGILPLAGQVFVKILKDHFSGKKAV